VYTKNDGEGLTEGPDDGGAELTGEPLADAPAEVAAAAEGTAEGFVVWLGPGAPQAISASASAVRTKAARTTGRAGMVASVTPYGELR
jgi:hypothetical protein